MPKNIIISFLRIAKIVGIIIFIGLCGFLVYSIYHEIHNGIYVLVFILTIDAFMIYWLTKMIKKYSV